MRRGSDSAGGWRGNGAGTRYRHRTPIRRHRHTPVLGPCLAGRQAAPGASAMLSKTTGPYKFVVGWLGPSSCQASAFRLHCHSFVVCSSSELSVVVTFGRGWVCQALILTQQAQRFLTEHQSAGPLPSLIAGDFNSLWHKHHSDAFDEARTLPAAFVLIGLESHWFLSQHCTGLLAARLQLRSRKPERLNQLCHLLSGGWCMV